MLNILQKSEIRLYFTITNNAIICSKPNVCH